MPRHGRSIASNGYVLIRVGKDHHLADVRGYAYEHRLVAEDKLGRRLRQGEIPHHVNGIKTDNRPENIEVVASPAHHHLRHRRQPSTLRHPDAPNPMVLYACGCGAELRQFDRAGRKRSYVSGHNPTKAVVTDAFLAALRDGPVGLSAISQLTGRRLGATRTLATKLVKERRIVRVARGHYGLPGVPA